MARHIFIDNSNTLGGAQKVATTVESGVPWTLIRLDLPSLFKLVEGTGIIATRVFSASGFTANHPVWGFARRANYELCLLRRVSGQSNREVEQGVDELLHLKMANAIIDHDAPQTMVIVSGDGNISAFGTSFVGQAERALRKGWYVNVCAWTPVMTGKYRDLKSEYPDKLSLSPLDGHYRELTFVKSGFLSYDQPDVTVAARTQSPLTDLVPQDD